METITTTVTVAKVQTLVDGGKRYTFDGLETETYQAALLMECQALGVAGRLTFEPIEDTKEVEEDEPEQQRSTRKIHI